MWDVVKLKRLISCFVLVALLVSLAPAAIAAGSASLSGPSVVRAGDTITLSFVAGGGIYGGSGSVSYDASQLTLQGYAQSVGGTWAVEFNGNNFVFYDNSMASPINGSTTIFTATFKVNAGLATGTAVTVTASGVTLSDGQSDMGMGSPSYSTTIAAPLSDNCNLAALNVTNAAISPAFHKDTLEYSASVPFSVSALNVTATAEHPGAKVTISDTALAAASTTAVKITVTAENGATKTYSIYVARAKDPNYVESSNANLSALTVEGYHLSPVFSADVTKYYVWLPYEAETLTVKGTAEDNKAKVTVGEGWTLEPGKGTEIPVTVTAENGTQQVYVVTAVRAPAPEDVERYLSCDHQEEPEPTEPPTEPVTEPEPTEPPTEATEPVIAPEEEPEQEGVNLGWLILTGVLCLVLGGAAGVAAMFWIRKRKPAPAKEAETP